jgi:uncharacterized protein YjbI with pentapeptide repeats
MAGVPPHTVILRPPDLPRLSDQLTATDLATLTLGDEARLESLELTGTLASDVIARSATIEDCRLRGSLAGARLHDLHLHDCDADGADLANVDLRGGALARLTLRNCRLTGAQLVETSIRDVTFIDCLLDFAVLAGAKLDRVLFRGCELREATLEQAQLRDVRLEHCDLSRALLGQSSLQRVELEACRLVGLRSFTDLRGAAMPWPDVVAGAGAFAAALGIAILEDEEPA